MKCEVSSKLGIERHKREMNHSSEREQVECAQRMVVELCCGKLERSRTMLSGSQALAAHGILQGHRQYRIMQLR